MKTFSQEEVIPFIDLTKLSDKETTESITELCQLAAKHQTASVCVPLTWVPLARSILTSTKVAVATVANFPSGEYPLQSVREEISRALSQGADELDIVIPYHELKAGNTNAVQQFIAAARSMWSYKKLKCILETAALTPDEVLIASQIAISEGADFLKTSTGKWRGASLDSFSIMLDTIYNEDHSVGIKASGGITEYEQVLLFLYKTCDVMGDDWVTPAHVRIGASQLLTNLIQGKTKAKKAKA